MNTTSTRIGLVLLLPLAVVLLAPPAASGQIAADRLVFGEMQVPLERSGLLPL